MTNNPADLLLLAKLCNAVYDDVQDRRESTFSSLGFEPISTYENKDHRAMVACNSVRWLLVLCGTRFSDGNWHELWDDDDLLPQVLADGSHVMLGFYAGMRELCDWALGVLKDVPSFEITGHSLGGARAHLTPLFIVPSAIKGITTFGSPKCADHAYWQRFTAPLVRVVHERDFAPGWPTISEYHQPEPMMWLHNSALMGTTESVWPGGFSVADHSIDKGYVPALNALVS